MASKDNYYEDCVYSTSKKTLFALTDTLQLEAWELGLDGFAPELIRTMGEFSSILHRKVNLTTKKELLQSRGDLTCWYRYHLVVAGEDINSCSVTSCSALHILHVPEI
ncbi:radical SAM domain protein [Striga asiatica]|uniref:Radical SAM domain protein n=1 Tax=Striga asiatica TaxID=4170 RepID=A0A5A7PZP2_STRAF|nr:radical SAM domain protein [Striga asiatica]